MTRKERLCACVRVCVRAYVPVRVNVYMYVRERVCAVCVHACLRVRACVYESAVQRHADRDNDY